MSETLFQPTDMVIEEIKLNSANRRKIYINEEVGRESMFKAIHLLDRIVRTDASSEDKKDIDIVLDCEGGTIYFGLALISKIMELRDKGYNVNITVNSIAMSMGAMFLIVGTNRRAFRYATIMLHSPLSGSWGKLQDIEDDADETRRLWKLLKSIIIENTNITDNQLEEIKKMKQDWYITPQEALKLGIIDEII